jgi:YVTN family beta-propeller protein
VTTRALLWVVASSLVPFLLSACGSDNNPPPAPTATVAATATRTIAPTATWTESAPPTATPTNTSAPTATATTVAPTPATTPTLTQTTAPTATLTATSAPTVTSTATATNTIAAPTPTSTATETATAIPTAFFQAPDVTDPSGPRPDGTTGVLPNGRIVSPVGRRATVETLPLNMRIGPNGHIFVTNDGNGDDDLQRYLQVIDPTTLEVQRIASTHFFGLAVSPDGQRVYVANGPNDRIDIFAFDGTTVSPVASPTITFPAKTFPMGIDIASDGSTLYVAGFQNNTFWRVDLQTGTTQQATTNIGNFPYSVVVSRDGSRAYVSSWGLNNGNPSNLVPVPLPPTTPNDNARSSVAVMNIGDTNPPKLISYVPIGRKDRVDNIRVFGGSHPSGMALSPDGTRLYVTATNIDVLSVIDTATNQLVTEMDLNVFGDGLQGLYPDAVTVSGDGSRIYVADAGINAVQVIDVDTTQRTFTPRGFIPTGWYPSAVALSADGTTLYVASAKGLGVGGNGGELVDISQRTLGSTAYYIGRIIKGMVSAIDLGTIDLDQGTAAVRANNGFDPVPAPVEADNPVPLYFGTGPSQQIKYVVYILKENRTYDQVLGDFERGNGDPRLTLFGEDITPNHHALARQYATGDNFFDDAEVSYPGHEWVTQGNNNDWVEKIWPFEYNNLLSTSFNIESGQEGFCENGYIFEALERQNVTYRTYGEPLAFNSRFSAGIDNGGVPSTLRRLIDAFGSVENLSAHIGDLLAGDIPKLQSLGVNTDILVNEVWPNLKLDYPSNILADKTDVYRAELFKGELEQFSANNNLPHFLFIWIPNDHTFGAAPNMPTPSSAVADNDQGLGMIVDALTKSPFWPQMAIFVTEDDAQDGQDHISAHRTISLVISPYVKHAYTSSVHHSNVGMLKTMELLLGVTPMSQYDRYATDMRDYFTSTPDLTPFTAVAARVRPEKNPPPDAAPNRFLRRAAKISQTLNLTDYDEAGPELSRVLWLVHVGEHVERQRRLATIASVMMAVFLVIGGMMVQRGRHSPGGG